MNKKSGYTYSGEPVNPIPPVKRKLKSPLVEYIRESDSGPYCSYCGSSLKKILIFWKSNNCINPKCKNYYKEKK